MVDLSRQSLSDLVGDLNLCSQEREGTIYYAIENAGKIVIAIKF